MDKDHTMNDVEIRRSDGRGSFRLEAKMFGHDDYGWRSALGSAQDSLARAWTGLHRLGRRRPSVAERASESLRYAREQAGDTYDSVAHALHDAGTRGQAVARDVWQRAATGIEAARGRSSVALRDAVDALPRISVGRAVIGVGAVALLRSWWKASLEHRSGTVRSDRWRRRAAAADVNVGVPERTASCATGALMLVTGLRRGGALGLLSAVAGAALVTRGATGRCQVYRSLGLDSAPMPEPARVRRISRS